VPRGGAFALGLLLAAAPGLAHACAVCNAGGSPANRFAFFLSTMVLSLLPLGLFFGAALWLRAQIRRRFADEFTEREVVSHASGSPAGAFPADHLAVAARPRSG
jgi:hypothetical protein